MARDSCLRVLRKTNSRHSHRLITAFLISGNGIYGFARAITTISTIKIVNIQGGRLLLGPGVNADCGPLIAHHHELHRANAPMTRDNTDFGETIQGSLHAMVVSTPRTARSRKCVIVATWSAWTDFTSPTPMNGLNAQYTQGGNG